MTQSNDQGIIARFFALIRALFGIAGTAANIGVTVAETLDESTQDFTVETKRVVSKTVKAIPRITDTVGLVADSLDKDIRTAAVAMNTSATALRIALVPDFAKENLTQEIVEDDNALITHINKSLYKDAGIPTAAELEAQKAEKETMNQTQAEVVQVMMEEMHDLVEEEVLQELASKPNKDTE